MGNKRDEIQNEGNAEVGVGIAGVLGILGLAVGGIASAVHNSKEEKNAQQRQLQRQQQIDYYNQQINDIDRRIADLRSEFMGSFLNGPEIDKLRAQRQQLIKARDEL